MHNGPSKPAATCLLFYYRFHSMPLRFKVQQHSKDSRDYQGYPAQIKRQTIRRHKAARNEGKATGQVLQESCLQHCGSLENQCVCAWSVTKATWGLYAVEGIISQKSCLMCNDHKDIGITNILCMCTYVTDVCVKLVKKNEKSRFAK